MSKNPLASADVFHGLTAAQLKLVEKKCTKVGYPKDEIIFKEGDKGDKMFLLVSGVVEIWKSEGEELKGSRLARLEEGEIFGEMSLFDEEPRSATAIASIERESLILVWEDKAIHQIIQEHPSVGARILQNLVKKMSKRLRSANDAIHILLRSNQYISL